MRPVALDLEGFAAFRERTLVDFTDADLFAIVGATGQGKSTLIDAICFALYGSVPRHGERDIAPVMTLGANETKVSFTFELGGDAYIATRVLRRKATGGGATTRDLRLERQHADGTTEILAGKKQEFDTEIQRLVGLDFDQFTKCVVLPQGQFADFLHARNAERVAILSALLDLSRYERMGASARDRAKRAAGRRDALTRERERVAAATPESLAAAREHCTAVVALRDEIDAAGPRDAALATELGEVRAEALSARAAAAALAGVRMPQEVRELGARVAEAAEAATNADTAATDADTAAAEAEAARDAAPALELLTNAAEAHTRRAEVASRIEHGRAKIAEQRSEVATADEQREAADVARAQAQAAVDEARHRHAHAELRAGLRVGEPCPVCEQAVTALPPKQRSTELTKARKALEAARTQYEKAEATARTVRTELAKFEAQLASLQERLGDYDAVIVEFPDPASLAARLKEVDGVRTRAVEARRTASALRKDAHAAARTRAELDRTLGKHEREMHAQRDAVVAAGITAPATGDESVAESWDTLAAWAVEALPEHEKHAAALDDRAAARAAERDALVDDLATRLDARGIEVRARSSVADLLAAATGAMSHAEQQVQRVEEQLARAAEIDRDIETARDEEAVAADLGRLLDRGHFTQWLVDEALDGLLDGATVLLERLSGGQYALRADRDGDLLVVDHVNADETRSVRSLSGGETFQASLALALALADRIADLAVDGAARLESIFLDEGFGTLDPETLDVVAGTIEALGQGERVVGVVTHVAELAERMPVRLRVRKEGRTSVVTREET
jgi:exonuclease SbcC